MNTTHPLTKPAYWAINKIFLNRKNHQRLMIVFRTPPCQKAINKGKCFICGFEAHALKGKDYDIASQFKSLQGLIERKKIGHLDLLSSGSLLDGKQIDFGQVLKLMKTIKKIKYIKSVLIEGRVEYCQFDKIKKIKKILDNIKLEYGIGLEAWSDYVRNTILRKDLKLEDYINLLKTLNKFKVGICTYILAGFPSLSLKKSLTETRNSIIKVVNLYQKYHCRGRIALFPIFVAPNTPLEDLFNQGKYQLINLQDILKILSEIKPRIDLREYPIFVGLDDENLANKIFLKPSNLKEKEALKRIIEFNFTQEV